MTLPDALKVASLLALALLPVAGCRSDRPDRLQPPSSRHEALRQLARCTFDDLPSPEPPAREIEAALRRAIRQHRYRFAVRAGQCSTALDPTLQAHDESLRALARAWDALLPLIQAPEPDDIAIERAIRHIGNAWRTSAGR